MTVSEENKPRPRRRGGRARAQNTGGVLANLHGINIAVEEVSCCARKKKSTMRQYKNKEGGLQLLMTIPDEEAKPLSLKVSKSAETQDTKVARKSFIPSQLDKENTVNIYTSPDAEISFSLSPAETATPKPPCSSVKVKPNRDVDDDAARILFSPLSSASASFDESVKSNRNRQDGVSDICNGEQSEEVETGSQTNSSVYDDDAETRTDSSEDYTLNEDKSDPDDTMSHQQGFADEDDAGHSVLSQDDESEDEDYSADEDSSNSDDEFEFEECESEKKQPKKGGTKGAYKDTMEGRYRDIENKDNDAVDRNSDNMSRTSSTNNILGTEEGDDVDGPGGYIADDFGEGENLVDPIDENVPFNDQQAQHVARPKTEESSVTKRIATESNQAPTPALPSLSEIYVIVDRLFHEADKDTVTVKNIVQKVAIHFDFPAVEKRTKAIIKRRLTDLIQGTCQTEFENTNYIHHHESQCDVAVCSEKNCPDAADVGQADEEAQISQSLGNNNPIHDDGGDEDGHYANDVFEQDLPPSLSTPDLPNHIDGERYASTVSEDKYIVGGHLLPSVDEPVIDEAIAGDGDSYVMFHNLSLDGSVKSRRASYQQPVSNNLAHIMYTPEKFVQQDLPTSPTAADFFSKIETQLTVATESSAPSVACHYLPPLNESTVHDEQEGDSNESIVFLNLSPDVSLKTQSAPGTHSLSVDHSNATTFSDPFREPSKSRSVVEKGKWSLGSQIGAGSFGRVYIGMNTMNGSIMAVKVLQIPNENKRAIVDDLQREIDLMRTLKHPNIVRYLGAEVDGSRNILNIFQEWVPGGCISTLLKKFGPFSINVVKSYLAQILDGLDYLHCHGIIHRDIKGGNILVSNDGAIKLADFGASKRIEAFSDQSDKMELSMRGTPYFMAPEVFEEKFGFKADIWSVGGVIYQMVTGSPPWKGMGFRSPVALFMHIKSHDRPPSLSRLNGCDPLDFSRLENILTVCFQREPSMRPSASAMKSHHFLRGTSDNTSESPILTHNQSNDRLPSLSPIGAIFLESPSHLSDDKTTENVSTALSDSLCYSLTMMSPFPKLNMREPTDISSWPDWAKTCEKENATANKNATNPYAKKSPIVRTS